MAEVKVKPHQFFILEDGKLFLAEKISEHSDCAVVNVKRGHEWFIERHDL